MDNANLIVMLLNQRQALQIADGYPRFRQGPGQDAERNIKVMRNLRAGC